MANQGNMTNETIFPSDLNCSDLNTYIDLLNDTYNNCSTGPFEGNSMYGATAMIFTQVFYALTFLVGLSGNTLVIYVVARFSKMQTVTNFYILNLALADELFLLGIPFLITTQAYNDWIFGDIMCKVYMSTTSLNQVASPLFLTVMSADRYIAVCQPINSTQFRTPLISKIVSLSAWSLSALMVTPMVMYANTLQMDGEANCNIFFPTVNNVSGHVIFTVYSFVLSFGVPFGLIFIFYLFVIHKLQTVGPKSKSKEKKKSHRKVTKLVLTVILVYVVCWLPYWVLQLTLISRKAGAGHSAYEIFTFVFCNCLPYINSAINPILYAFLSENFKKSFIKAFACIKNPDGAMALNAEHSAQPRRQRDGLSSRSALCLTDAVTGDRRSSHVPMSRDASSAMTLSSRAPHSHTSEDQNKNGHLLEVPHIVHAPPRSPT